MNEIEMTSLYTAYNNFLKLIKFSITGVASAAIYISISYTMIKIIGIEVIISSMAAFFISGAFSYLLNTMWSFSRESNSKYLCKFVLVSAFSSLMASIILNATIKYGGGYWLGTIIVLSTIPLLTFFIHHSWTYRS